MAVSEETRAGTADQVLQTVQGIARELHPLRRGLAGADLDSSLDRDFGLDSLGRAELLTRLERDFDVRLPETLLGSAETPRDLLRAVVAGSPASRFHPADTFELTEPAEPAPARTRTLLEVLDWHVQRHPDRPHILYYAGEDDPEVLSYGELDRRARAVAAGLVELGIGPGKAVGIMLPTGLEYFAAFFGTQLAGGIPVPLYPPARKSQIEDHLRRQAGILETAQAEILVAFPEVLPLARFLRAQLPGLRQVVTVAEVSGGTGRAVADVGADDIAFLQFTSGSTGDPKGVTLTHANLLANLRVIGHGLELGPDDVAVSWLPLYHDMGLIGSWMGSLYHGLPLVLMSPLTFLAQPSRWLRAIHRHRGTVSPAPNFAYELCARKIKDEDIAGLDLSSWRVAPNGAEPISPGAMRRFTERFAPYGFRPEAMTPVYGLAECSLGLAFPPLGRGPRIDTIDRETFQGSGQAVPASPDDPRALRFVSCGFPAPEHQVRIVDDRNREVGERQEGRLEFQGPSATQGYYRNPEATQRLIRDGWVDSGDRAYIAGGEVFITGRVKDIIIRAGRNLYPHELEEAVGEIPGVRKGCVAVFGSPDPGSGTERLVIAAEIREGGEAEHEPLRQAIQDVAVDLLGTPADDVALVPPQSLPKTSSGKIRRAESRILYESGRLGRGGRGLGWQLARLAISGFRLRAARRLRTAGDWAYALWVLLMFALLFPLSWVLIAITPGLQVRRRLARRLARNLAFLTGTLPRVQGLERLAGDTPKVLTLNHQSYLDAFILTAALPPNVAFVAKKELQGNFFSRILLQRVGSVFVERFDAGQGVEETRKVADAVRAGDSVAIFPEGTFTRAPGLLPFRMGAFVVAAQAGAPLVPIALRGTRSKLRDGEWFPRRGRIEMEILPPLQPDGVDWGAAVRLREAARAAILAACDEPDLS